MFTNYHPAPVALNQSNMREAIGAYPSQSGTPCSPEGARD